jgi:hypothetical protein
MRLVVRSLLNILHASKKFNLRQCGDYIANKDRCFLVNLIAFPVRNQQRRNKTNGLMRIGKQGNSLRPFRSLRQRLVHSLRLHYNRLPAVTARPYNYINVTPLSAPWRNSLIIHLLKLNPRLCDHKEGEGSASLAPSETCASICIRYYVALSRVLSVIIVACKLRSRC